MSAEDMSILREVLADPGFARILAVLRSRWETYGRAAGRVVVETREEAVALGGLLGKRPSIGAAITTAAIERVLLHETRFACTLRDALEVHFRTTLTSNAERRDAREEAWRATLAELTALIERASLTSDVRSIMLAWISEEATDFRRRYTQGAKRLVGDFGAVIRAVERLPSNDDVCALAVLADTVFGDPHALDVGAPAAGLFDRALARLNPELDSPLSRGAEGRDELLSASGIAKDRTSPKVDVFGLRSICPGYAHLREHPLATFSLRALEGMRGGHLRAAGDVAFVVENPPVFDQIVERLLPLPSDLRPTVVCTNGQLNLADRLLLAELQAGGAGLRYAGDFDPAGLRIARSVLERYPNSATLWRMTADDYRRALRPDSPRLQAAEIPHFEGALVTVGDAMRDVGRAGYQEALLADLAEDVMEIAFTLAVTET